jgi:2-polyprenyl-3-methyl-5-hydroxy-6-metoxy-1,4-benzoquinol methylase
VSKVINKVIDEWNEIADSEWYRSYRTDEVIQKVINEPETVFYKQTWNAIKTEFSDLKGKKICVPSSGNNHVAFAFAVMGAKVTSCDICEKQLKYAELIAKDNNLDIEFLVQDTMKLADIKAEEYDMVYTSEGVHVWINDLSSMYQNIARIVKKGGFYINFEIHPFTRPFAYEDGKPETMKITVQKPYDMTGPFNEGTTYNWRMQDLLNAIASAGLRFEHLDEIYDDRHNGHFWFYEDVRAKMTADEINDYYDWRVNPYAALPQWFTLYATK